ncbi:MAG: SDR family NAD(P)-dependent oxidoreductase, partial [Planctomycetaceae bacterium]|nr:SDR family NAD(P)-dependent oxidoreductase [Planctomycetaceae bacterium]
MRLEGKRALVTGAGRGIGRGCAFELARDGANLVINDRPGSPDLETTANDIRALGGDCQAVEADGFSSDGCEQLLGEVGPLDKLVSKR